MKDVEIKHKNPEALAKVQARIERMSQKEIAIGFLPDKGQPYPDGTPVADVAAHHVFGIDVPERDFMELGKSMMLPKIQPMLRKIILIAAERETLSDRFLDASMESVAVVGQSEIQSAIVDGFWPPNSDNPMSEALREKVSKSWDIDIPSGMSYREAKMKYHGSDKPLIDTGHMLQSVTYSIRDRKEK